MTPEERLETIDLCIKAVEILKAELKPDGLNLGYNLGAAAGAELKDNIHQHIVPRWVGDTNFMPVFSGTRVMHQALLEQYDVLRPLFNPYATYIAEALPAPVPHKPQNRAVLPE